MLTHILTIIYIPEPSLHISRSAHSELVPYFMNATRRCYSSANPITCSMLLDNPDLLSAQQRSPGVVPTSMLVPVVATKAGGW